MRYLSTVALAISAVLSCAALAKNNDSEQRHADAHVHGVGQLNLAIEGKQVHLELDIPGFDILGFESINSDAQREALSKAVQALKQPDLWGFTDAAGCQLQTVSVATDSHAHHGHGDAHDHHHESSHAHSDEHDHKHEGSHGHRDEHDHKHEDGHAHVDGHDHQGEQATAKSTHMDFAATYVYQCAQPQQLKHISTRLFDRFHHSATLKVQGLTDAGQMAGTMTRSQPETMI